MAPGAEAFHCSDPGHPQPGASGRNLGALKVQLPADDLREIDTAPSKITIYGGRMNPAQMELVDATA